MLHHHAVLLEDLAADVEGQVLGVDDAAHEAQVGRQEFLVVVGDEDAADVELDAGLVVGVVEVEGSLRRDVEEGRVLDGALGLGVHPQAGDLRRSRRCSCRTRRSPRP